jgi:hypothetical protein
MLKTLYKPTNQINKAIQFAVNRYRIVFGFKFDGCAYQMQCQIR